MLLLLLLRFLHAGWWLSVVSFVFVHKRGVDIDKDTLLPLSDRRVSKHGRLYRGRGMIIRIKDSGPDVQRLRGNPQSFGELLQHLRRGLPQPAFDLAEVRIGDP